MTSVLFPESTASLKWHVALAGINAARRAQDLATVVVPRDSSYLGTLVDDLVTKVALHHCFTS